LKVKKNRDNGVLARKVVRFLFVYFILSTFNFQLSTAQYYDWGPSPASVRWRPIKTPDVKLIYPRDFDENARRTMWYLDTVRTHIDHGFRHGAMRTPVVLHTQNMGGNGMVMWAPRRMELLAAPAAAYSEPWLKQLSIHEYRHNVQYNNLRRGTNRVLTWLLGEQIAFLGSGQFSIYILEGDAPMAETEFSAFGRGLQPSWTIHYRAMADSDSDTGLRRKSRQRGAVGSDDYSGDYWFSGSFRDHVPSHYHLGYQMVRWSYDRLGDRVWDDVARYVSRNPQFIIPMGFGLRRGYGMGETELFRRTFADLNAHWDSLPRVEDSSERIVTPENSYTTYQWPLWLDEATLVAFKSDLLGTSRIVRVDAATGAEKVLTHTGRVSSRPVLSEGVLWWTEFRRSVLWDERVLSRLCSYDFATGQKQTHAFDEQIFYPTPMPGGGMAYVVYDYSGRFSIVAGEGDHNRLDLPENIEVTGLAWDDATDRLYFIGLDDGGMFLASANGDRYELLTPSRHITISDLRAGGGKLYFGSIVSGKDEAHCHDLATGTEYRLSESTYGSFQPSTPTDGRVALTTYDRHGYHLAVQDTATATVQQRRDLPVDLVNPPWKRWNVPKMDSLVYTPAEAERSVRQHTSRRFSRIFNIFQPHSWVPADFYPPAAISESDLTMNLGATVMSQSLLSDAVSWLAYGWARRGGSMVRGGMSYNGLGPLMEVDFSWGGAPQTAYTQLPAQIAGTRKKQLSFTGRLSLPMTVSSGSWYATLTPAAEYHYTNGLIFRFIDETHGELTRGVERLSLSLRYSGQRRMAQSEFQPRWGFSARVGYVVNPTNSDFRKLWSASVGSWLPGVVRPHGIRLRATWQQTVGKDDAPFMFRMKEVFPRGARYDFSAARWLSGSIDYQLPVWYPEGGLTSIIYFKRVRLNLFADYARWRDFGLAASVGTSSATSARPPAWHSLYSYGADIILDLSPLRLPSTDSFSAVFTFARPSDRRGIFFNFGLEVPL
jgi:hypothetical protein